MRFYADKIRQEKLHEDILDPTPKDQEDKSHFKRLEMIKKFVKAGDHPDQAYVKAQNVVKKHGALEETHQKTILFLKDRRRQRHKYDANRKKHDEDKDKVKLKMYEEAIPVIQKPKRPSDAVRSSVEKMFIPTNKPIATNYINATSYVQK